MMSFTYSGNSDHGATDHWGSNLGWDPVPAMATRHHLVYTYDGTTQKIYAEGALQRSAELPTTRWRANQLRWPPNVTATGLSSAWVGFGVRSRWARSAFTVLP